MTRKQPKVRRLGRQASKSLFPSLLGRMHPMTLVGFDRYLARPALKFYRATRCRKNQRRTR